MTYSGTINFQAGRIPWVRIVDRQFETKKEADKWLEKAIELYATDGAEVQNNRHKNCTECGESEPYVIIAEVNGLTTITVIDVWENEL